MLKGLLDALAKKKEVKIDKDKGDKVGEKAGLGDKAMGEEKKEPENVKKNGAIDAATLERINAIENKLPKLDISIAALKRENDELKTKLARIDSNIIEMLSLYEVVANQVNPFVGLSKVTSANIERVERMQEEIAKINEKLSTLNQDIELLITRGVNIFDIIKSVTQGA
jgi:flagellar protein FlaC